MQKKCSENIRYDESAGTEKMTAKDQICLMAVIFNFEMKHIMAVIDNL